MNFTFIRIKYFPRPAQDIFSIWLPLYPQDLLRDHPKYDWKWSSPVRNVLQKCQHILQSYKEVSGTFLPTQISCERMMEELSQSILRSQVEQSIREGQGYPL